MGHILFHKSSHKIYLTLTRAIWDFGHLIVALIASPPKILTLYTKSIQTSSSFHRNTLGGHIFEWNLQNLRHLWVLTERLKILQRDCEMTGNAILMK